MLKNNSVLKNLSLILLVSGFTVASWVIFAGGYFQFFSSPDANQAKNLQPFITGLVMPLFTLGSTLLVLENLRNTSLQNFSNNFFKLLEHQRKLLEGICEDIDGITQEDKPVEGKEVFDALALRIACDFKFIGYEVDIDSKSATSNEATNSVLDDDGTQQKVDYYYDFLPSTAIDVDGLNDRDRIRAIYDYYFHVHHSSLGHYFRHLYYVVRYASKAPFSEEVIKDHIAILRAQLSNYEILLLAYNGMHDYGKEFYPLIEKFELLKSLNNEAFVPKDRVERIIDVEVLIDAYPNHEKHFEKGLKRKAVQNKSPKAASF